MPKILKTLAEGRFKHYVRIEHPVVVLVEGMLDANVIEALLNNIYTARKLPDNIQIIALGQGITPKAIENLFSFSGFADVQKLAIIVDGDLNPQGAFDSIKNALALQQVDASALIPFEFFGQSPRIGIFVVPAYKRSHSGAVEFETGTLEHYYLHSEDYPDNLEPSCLAFLQHILEEEGSLGSPDSLTNKQAKLASAVLMLSQQALPDLGIHARDKKWNLNSPVLDELRQFLSQLF